MNPKLPKWCGSFATGEPVTPEQAREVVFRTDIAVVQMRKGPFSGHFGWHDLPGYLDEYRYEAEADDLLAGAGPPSGYDRGTARYDAREAWLREMRVLATNHVHVDWLYSASSEGPSGWVSPQGRIDHQGWDVGKWPTGETLLEDWREIAAAFPFLDLVWSVYDPLATRDRPVMLADFVVADGRVELRSPDPRRHRREPQAEEPVGEYGAPAWPWHWFDEFAVRSRAAAAKVLGERHG